MINIIKNQKSKIKNCIVFVLFFALQGCYEDYIKDFDYTAVFFGAQQPLRTLVSRVDQDELVFRIGVGLGGVRENVKGYEVKYMLAPELLSIIDGADKLKLLPANCYTIENDDDFTFYIHAGRVIGDCQVRINKNAFVALEGSLDVTWALPLRLLSTTADSIQYEKDWTIIAIKYIDEHSGFYYCRGSQSTNVPISVEVEYYNDDWSQNSVRTLTTISPTEFNMTGMGAINSGITAADHLKIILEDGIVSLETRAGNTNIIEDLGSTYDAENKIFELNYKYTKDGVTYTVSEQLKLRQDPELELRFETWQ